MDKGKSDVQDIVPRGGGLSIEALLLNAPTSPLHPKLAPAHEKPRLNHLHRNRNQNRPRRTGFIGYPTEIRPDLSDGLLDHAVATRGDKSVSVIAMAGMARVLGNRGDVQIDIAIVIDTNDGELRSEHRTV